MGPKKGKGPSRKTDKIPVSRGNRSRSVTPGRSHDDSEENADSQQSDLSERATRRGKRKTAPQAEANNERKIKTARTRAEASFVEDDQLVHMTADGQETEYGSEEDEAPLNQSFDSEVQFNFSHNSNVEFAKSNKSRLNSSNASCVFEQDAGNGETVHKGQGQSVQFRPVGPAVGIDEATKKEIIGEAIGHAVNQFQEMFNKSGFLETASMLQQQLAYQRELQEKSEKQTGNNKNVDKGRSATQEQANNLSGSQSEATIYRNALQDGTKRVSSSSEEDVSDNPLIVDDVPVVMTQGIVGSVDNNLDHHIDRLIVGERKKVENDQRQAANEPMPSTSRGVTGRDPTPEDRAQEVVRQAELAKGKNFPTPGETDPSNLVHFQNDQQQYNVDVCNSYVHSAMVDEHYQLVGSHVDPTVREKISKGDYVDFGKLIPRDRLQSEEEDAYRLIFKGGQQFWAPATNRTIINSFSRWEQAFRVFSHIYLKTYPHRSSELVQYNHIIFSASQEYQWGNVYNYDKDFRMHLAIFPARSWGIILQQAWTLRLKEKLRFDEGKNVSTGAGNHSKDRSCGRFNRGKCTYGNSCKFEHKCRYCNRWGHGTYNCRKLKADKGGNVPTVGGSPGQKMDRPVKPEGFEKIDKA